MQSIKSTAFEASKDTVLDHQWGDAVDDDDTSECWTQPWDLPDGANCADHSDIPVKLRDLTADSTSNNVRKECLNSKG